MEDIKMEEILIYDTIIVGAGPGGLTAAIYTSRANMSTLILDGGLPGGQLNNTEEIENFPGFSHISGPELASTMFEHAQKFGAEYKYGIVNSIVKEKNVFKVVAGKTTYLAKSVIVATGTKYKKLGVPGEEDFTGRGVSWCAVCDGAFYRNKHVVVVGGGDSAVEEATYLTKFASKVTVIHRRDKFRAQPILVDRMLKNEKIEVIYNAEVNSIDGENKVTGVELYYNKGKYYDLLDCDGVFEYVGMNPVSDFIDMPLVKDEEGWIVTDEKMATAVHGLFAIGDIRKDATRQVVVATGDGCIAALQAQHYVESL
jgi:thioredoxin reductase (NADPH)